MKTTFIQRIQRCDDAIRPTFSFAKPCGWLTLRVPEMSALLHLVALTVWALITIALWCVAERTRLSGGSGSFSPMTLLVTVTAATEVSYGIIGADEFATRLAVHRLAFSGRTNLPRAVQGKTTAIAVISAAVKSGRISSAGSNVRSLPNLTD